MRRLLVSLALLSGLAFAGTAQAERKMFIISADVGGYGVDRCLANGAACGAPAAAAYCRSQNFATAMSFSKVDRDDITGAIPAGGSGGCKGASCDDVVAIVCSR
ncbi:hypothetical protein [Undibacter mobilis]|uniref:DUF4189 domain-containing protein n=1 Tax=Undibacter mobilis TaxID=2292256 RepID=A0A371B375_9BRAD|nr:hypothetical protein [Undibacter mobilis]RDV01957.1 hypothetical protein DXH78_15215 [Undibacter mobilis]